MDHDSERRAHGTAFLVLLTAVALTLVAYYAASARIDTHRQEVFLDVYYDARAAIQRRMDSYVAALDGTAALFYASERVTREEFHAYVRRLDIERRYPGIHSIGFIRHVPGSGAGTATRAADGDDTSHPCGYSHDDLFPAAGTTDYVSVDFVEPPLRSPRLAAPDGDPDPACRAAIERARDAGAPASTGPMPMHHQGEDRTGFILVLPIYGSDPDRGTVEARRAAVSGYVFASFLADTLFGSIARARGLHGVNFRVHAGSGTGEETLLYDHAPAEAGPEADDDPAFRRAATLDVGQKPWTVEFYAGRDFHGWNSRAMPYTVLTVGLLLSALLYRMTLVQGRRLEERQAYSASFERQATHDSLTGLGNRNLLQRELERVCAGVPDGRSALLLADLDGFKEINDALGHQSGDMLLQALGPRLEPLVPPGGTLARIGGDEFALVMTGGADERTTTDLAQRVLAAIREPFDLDGARTQVDASVGVAFCPDHGRDPTTLMRCADVAMYQAKDTKAGLGVYDPGRDEHSARRLSLITDLDRAIGRDELRLHYQPKLSLREDRVLGVEALIRWQHPDEGLLPPSEFIPQAERSLLIRRLTLWVIETAVQQCAEWHRAGLTLAVAVNISPRNLLDTELPTGIERILGRSAIEPSQLELEITETAIILDPARAARTLDRIHSLGVRITIDDFGTGYSSLAYLKRLPVSTLKVDRSFVRDVAHDANDAAIVRSTIHLAHDLGLEIVAEGIETETVLTLLREMGCDQGQGFFIARPEPADVTGRWLQARAPAGGARMPDP